jgi:hypothetical protein
MLASILPIEEGVKKISSDCPGLTASAYWPVTVAAAELAQKKISVATIKKTLKRIRNAM